MYRPFRTSALLLAILTLALAGCSPSVERSSDKDAGRESPPAAEVPAADEGKYIDGFTEVVPTSANEKAVAAAAGTYYDAWADYKHGINPDTVLPTLEELGGNAPKFIGYKIDAYSGKDADGNQGQFSLIVSGEQMNIAPEIGWKAPIDLADESTLDFFSTRTPLDSWDSDPHHEPQSEAEKAAVAKAQDFVETLPAELLFSRDRVRLGGYTLFWGEKPSSEAYLILSVQPGENAHYASANWGPMR